MAAVGGILTAPPPYKLFQTAYRVGMLRFIGSWAPHWGKHPFPKPTFVRCLRSLAVDLEQSGYKSDDGEAEASQVLSLSTDGGECIFKITADSITADTVCLTCGGRGHVSRLDGQSCLTSTLGIKIPREELEKTTYPSGITFPTFKFNRRGAARASTSVRPKPRPRSTSGYRSSEDKKLKDKPKGVRTTTQQPAPETDDPESDEEDHETTHDVQLAVDLGEVKIQ